MKKTLFIAITLFGAQFMATAQDTESTEQTATATTTASDKKSIWYVGFGATGKDDFKINDRLKNAGMPQLGNAAFEVTIGHETMGKDFLVGLEWNTSYMDEKTSSDRVRNVNAGIKLRFHYMPWKTDRFFLSTGADFSYTFNNFNLYTRGNTIDMDDLDPSTHTGHINLYNNQFRIGPSVMFAAFEDTNFPVRLVAGYEFALYSSKWESEVASVTNSFRESGQGSWYARLVLPL